MNTQRTNIIIDDELSAAANVDDATIIAILNLQPMLVELEVAVVRVSSDGEVLAKSGHPLTGKLAQIVGLPTADEDDAPPVR